MFLFLVLLASLSGCNPASHIISNEYLYTEKIDVSMTAPNSWRYVPCGARLIRGAQKFYPRPFCNASHEEMDVGGFSIINNEISQMVFTIERIPKIMATDLSKKDLSKEFEFLHKNGLPSQFNNLNTIGSGPARVGDNPGYQFTYTFNHNLGLTIKGTSYYFHHKDWIYVLTYLAPKRYYFDKYLHKFEKLVKSFHVGKNPGVESSIESYRPPLEEDEGY